MFLLCADGFTSLIAREEIEEQLHGVSICRRVPSTSHLLYADDSLQFCQASKEELHVVKEILQLYASTSGQCINFEKPSIYFSIIMGADHKEWIKSCLGVREVDRFETYLGLPTLIGLPKYRAFSFLKDRIWKKLQGWKVTMLLRAGKGVLIKVVAQSIPMYTMGVFQLPVKLCDELNSICAKFWWGQVGNVRKIHWKN